MMDLVVVRANGTEGEVIRTMDLSRHVPTMLVVGALPVMNAGEQRAPSATESSPWEHQLAAQGYVLAITDGSDRIYIRADHLETLEQVNAGGESGGGARRDLRQLMTEQAERLQRAHDAHLDRIRLEHQRAIEQYHAELVAKERTIVEQVRALKAYRAAYYPLNLLLPALRRSVSGLNRTSQILRPRLGNLRQYLPRDAVGHASRCEVAAPVPAPRISVVTPSYGQARFIERTIESVVAQAYPNLEYLVQDGGSTDGTVDILRQREGRLSSWQSAPDRGQAHAINLAFARTRGEIMGWLNSDDLLLPGALARVADHFTRHPEIDVVYGNRLLIDEDDREIGRWILPGHDDKVLKWADYIPQETLFWRRSLWDQIGGRVDESFQFAMDWDLLIRFQQAGARFAHLPHFMGAFRVHAEQKTSAAIEGVGFAEMSRIRARVWGRVPHQSEIRRAIRPFLLRHVLVDLGHRVRSRLGIHQ